MEVSSELSLLNLALLSIQNNNIDELDKTFRAMPLEDVEETEGLLNIFLSYCAQYRRKEAAKLVLERWKVIYPVEEKLPMLSRLFLINKINLPTLSFVVLAHPAYTYVECMDDLASFDSSPAVISACSKAEQIFGDQTYQTYEVVLKNAQDQENDNVENYILENIRKVAPFAPKPDWVKNYLGGDLMTEAELYRYTDTMAKKSLQFEIPTDDKIVEILTEGLSDLGITLDEMEGSKEFLRKQLVTMSREDKIELLKPFFKTQEQLETDKDELVFRTYGPANPLVDQDLTLDTPSAKYGGCRMFLCDLFDYDEEFDYLEPWFKGYCDECNKRIAHSWYAVRRPRDHGGFEGAYCSWKCVRDSLFTDGLEPALLTRELINIFEKQVSDIGIQDRLENKE